MRRIVTTILISAAALSAVSCSFLDREPDIIEAGTFYNSESEVQYGLAGIYGVMNNEQVYGNYYSLMLSNVDDLSYFNRSTTNNFSQQYTHDASSTEIYDAWKELYAGIGNANAFMEAVYGSEYDPDHKYYYEAKFLRAYYHFLLAQAWGDVPLKTQATRSPDKVMSEATPQYEILKWAASEMEDCLEYADETLTNAPYRVTRPAMKGILARVYLFMAGESVERADGVDKAEYLAKAREHAWDIIQAAPGLKMDLNPSYAQVFIDMISNDYGKDFNESMWEVDFLGDRSSSSAWTNGRIGDLIGLQSTGGEGFANFSCNYSYGQYNGSLKLFNLYYEDDRTDEDIARMAEIQTVTAAGTVVDLTDEDVAEQYCWDKRQAWNLCPYNYGGNEHVPEYPDVREYVNDNSPYKCEKSIDKTPYVVNKVTTSQDPAVARGIRNCGKWRREVKGKDGRDWGEEQMKAKDLYTCINFPILRFSDVLLMFAEADNELNGVTEDAYNCILRVRDRAGISTKDKSTYNQDSFRQLIRNERGRELCFEALRKYDLIRWGILTDAMKDYLTDTQDPAWPSGNDQAGYAANIGAAVQEKHILLPIPSIELGVNTLLVQNKYW